MTDDAKKAEELLNKSKDQTRVTSEAPDTDADSETKPLDEAIAEAFARLDDDELTENLTIRDDRLAAMFAALERTDRLDDVEADCIDYLDRDDDTRGNKSSLAQYLIRVGIVEVASDVMDDAKSGYRIHLDNQADAF